MEDKIKIRTAAKGWLTRATNTLSEVLSSAPVDLFELRSAIDDFDSRLTKVDNAQSEVELELEQGKLDEDIEAAYHLRKRYVSVRTNAARVLASKEEGRASVASDASSNHFSTTSAHARLPKLELPHFSDNPLQWTSFWDQFCAIIGDSEMPEIQKFVYLRSILEGEAKATIEGLTLTATNYLTACELLKQRYGRKDRIIFAHVQELLKMEVPKRSRLTALWSFYNELLSHTRSLEALGIGGDQYGAVLTPLILSRIPPELRKEWARTGESHESDLSWLLEFLKTEITRLEISQSYSSPTTTESKEKSSHPLSTAAALQSSSGCPVCNKSGHSTSQCFMLRRTPLEQRQQLLRQACLCYKCLTAGAKGKHLFRQCTAKCSSCKGAHHVILCDSEQTQSGKSNESTTHNIATAVCSSHSKQKTVLLQTAQVTVRGKQGSVVANVLFDTGSDKSYASESFVSKVNPEWVSRESFAFCNFGNAKPTASTRNVYELLLQAAEGEVLSLLATEVPVICSPLCAPSVPDSVFRQLGDVTLASVTVGQELIIDILLGLDSYWRFMTSDIVSLSSGLMAQRSVFGWVVSGYSDETSTSVVSVSPQLFCLSDFSGQSASQFWDLETIGLNGKESSIVDENVIADFNQSVSWRDKRYEVSLPWKPLDRRPKLLNNVSLAKQRLAKLSSRLYKDPGVAEQYRQVFDDYREKGFIEEVGTLQADCSVSVTGPSVEESGPVFYLPHHPVIKESSRSTKVRPVFDASAKGHNGVSLNDCLETGPSLIPNLPGILIRFRRWPVVVCADVIQAFLQIKVKPAERDVHRFLLQDDGLIKVMRFAVVPFVNKSSPFLLNATVKHHLSNFDLDSKTVQELRHNLYVDDFISGCEDASAAFKMIEEADSIMKQAGMTLSKWTSNSKEVGELLNKSFGDRTLDVNSHKVLGMHWDSSEDCLGFDGVVVSLDLCVTKRVILSVIAQLFDPFGLLTPFIMVAKGLFQTCWRLGLGWDEVVSDELRQRFLSWVCGLSAVREWKIFRSYTSGRWNDVSIFQLHAFGDASERGYGACVYLRVLKKEGSWCSSLVFSKARVAPLKPLTLPRLELLAALMCARLLEFVRDALQLPSDVSYTCWTDSTVVLAWVKSDPSRWKTFVCNRVAEIQSLSNPAHWRHCPGSLNPADLASRGISGEELVKSNRWLHGPDFLQEDGDEPEFDCMSSKALVDSVCDLPSLDLEAKQGYAVMSSVRVEPLLDFTRYSDFCSVLRVVGWVCRFVHNLRVQKVDRVSGDLTLEELQGAKTLIFRITQETDFSEEILSVQKGHMVSKKSSLFKLLPFLDDEGLLRVRGRLQFSDIPLSSKHPVILPNCHLSLLYIRFLHHFFKHAGVNTMLVRLREEFWVIGARRLCKRVRRECLPCKRLDAKAGDQPVPPLPRLRVSKAPPFSVTGLDHGGPLFCLDCGKKKFYFLLFTCAIVRAVHLELVDSLSDNSGST